MDVDGYQRRPGLATRDGKTVWQMEELPLVGYIEIARRAGVQRPVVTGWRSKVGFPEPVAELHVGPVWWWPDIRDWLELTDRRHDADITVDEVHASRDRWRAKNGPIGPPHWNG